MHFVSERMGVDGRCFQVRMSEQFLNHPYIHTSLIKMCGKGVAQAVCRNQPKSGACRVAIYHGAKHFIVHCTSAMDEELLSNRPLSNWDCTAHAQILLQPPLGCLPEDRQALVPSFTLHVDITIFEIEAVELYVQ